MRPCEGGEDRSEGISRRGHRFVASFAPVVTGRSNYFRFISSTVI